MATLAGIIEHHFADRRLLRQAVSHSSAAALGPSYERLEFLGDRVLGLVVAEMLWHRFPAEPEGMLARRYAGHVRREALAEVARTIDLGRFILLARGEEEEGGRAKEGTLADCLEAVIGALYLDGGLDAAARFIHRHWERRIAERTPPREPKTALQEWAQGRGLPLPRYETVASDGPDHAPAFTVAVSIEGRPAATATGKSKRIAERAAAAALLAVLAGEDRR
ncbi:MAG: ribonuclease III [Alphaproteobacteria bacterium]|nr:ribonuclease III [Alphaproteobacteria bacterium]